MEDYDDRENPFHFLSDSQLLGTRHYHAIEIFATRRHLFPDAAK